MENAERLMAFENLFVAASLISDGERNLVGFLLANDGEFTRQDIADVFDVSFKTAFRWLHRAVENGTLAIVHKDRLDRGCILLSRLRELANGDS